jgi:dipeptidyl aminopeptidase/acylaminoacyl peptidase
MKIVWALVLVSLFVFILSRATNAQQTKKPFTVADDIGLTLFVDRNGGEPELHFSPDQNYFAVWSERGVLNSDRVEDSLRFYRTADVRNFLSQADGSHPPPALWAVRREDKEGRIIESEWRWLADSSGVAFVQRAPDGTQSLVLADLRKKTVGPLTPPATGIKSFDIRDRNHYVYTASDPREVKEVREKQEADRSGPAIAGTGKQLVELIFPKEHLAKEFSRPKSYLWAVLGSERFEVKDHGMPITPDRELALSPDSQTVVTRTKVPSIPSWWEKRYPPPYPSDPDRLQPGKTNVYQFVRIDLRSGNQNSLTDAPISGDAGNWAWVDSNIQWSNDGQAVLLPGTYVKPADDQSSRPCVAVVELIKNATSCVEALKGHTATGREEGYHPIGSVQFENGKRDRVLVTSQDLEPQCSGITQYTFQNEEWQVSGHRECSPEPVAGGLKVTVKEGFNEPPRVVASSGQNSQVLWDPNPQLASIDLGEATVYKWKDKDGHEWEDGLYTPPNFEPGKRYPLVIQTHGFPRTRFTPSGVFPTAYAARELAAQGILVLQLAYHCSNISDPSEGPCMASEFASAAKQLVADGIAEPDNIGIIGFSRSCYHVMEALTTNALRLKAASITDGVMEDYLQYMLWPERDPSDTDRIIGERPFGKGLEMWLKRSPGFNLDKITAPLLINGEGRESLLLMWQPYAGLFLLNKPVDVILLNTDEHVLTNPAVRMASQGGSVDWFRFWLQGYEDPDPAKADQYKRWRELRKLQAGNDKTSSTSSAVSN